MEESFRIGRVAGIRIGANWSLLVVLWLLTWGVAGGRYPAEAPGYEPEVYWVAGLTTAAVFYAALLAHELSHALVGRRAGVRVEGITLWLFGGVTKMRGETGSPQLELRMAAASPLVSLVAAGAMAVAALGLDAADAPTLLITMAAWLARINLILAVFNLIPAAAPRRRSHSAIDPVAPPRRPAAGCGDRCPRWAPIRLRARPHRTLRVRRRRRCGKPSTARR